MDSGTLLDLIRQGGILENDNGLDLGISFDSIAELEKAMPEILKIGYKAYVRSYQGLIFKVKFVPISSNLRYEIDINVFCRSSAHAWCPQVFCIEN